MRRTLAFIIPLLSIYSLSDAYCQDLQFRKEINSIDSILRENPYKENFLGITYYYSIDITESNELVVKMDFDGPFATTFSAKIKDINITAVADTGEYTSSMCWQCMMDDKGKNIQCVRQENQYKTGENEVVSTDELCLMLPVNTNLRIKLIRSIGDLLKKASQQ